MAILPDISGTEQPGGTGTSALSSAIGSFIIGESAIGGPASPPGSPGLTQIVPSYAYWWLSDDQNIQALIAAWNQIAQGYLDSLNTLGLPDYTGEPIYGALLDWVAQGLYGIAHPVLPSGTPQINGPLGQLGVGDGVPLGTIQIIGPSTYYVTDDDIFKRIITWHFFKGDGKVFSLRWLKRRVMRFLTGANGQSPNIDQTYRISVTFGTGNQVNIRIIDVMSNVIDGAIPGILEPGFDPTLGSLVADNVTLPGMPFAQQLKDAIDYGALELPVQFTYVVSI